MGIVGSPVGIVVGILSATAAASCAGAAG
jgi:hypothetical protein